MDVLLTYGPCGLAQKQGVELRAVWHWVNDLSCWHDVSACKKRKVLKHVLCCLNVRMWKKKKEEKWYPICQRFTDLIIFSAETANAVINFANFEMLYCSLGMKVRNDRLRLKPCAPLLCSVLKEKLF